MYYPTLEECRKLRGPGVTVPVCREIPAGMDTPLSAFLKVHRGGYGFLLESVPGGERLARYSYIGTEPYRVAVTREGDGAGPLDSLAEELQRSRPVPVAGLSDFDGGAVGYLGYESARRFETLPAPAADTLGLPESLFMFTDTFIAFDHQTHSIKVISRLRREGNTDSAYQEATRRIDSLVARLRQPQEFTPRPSGPAGKNGQAVSCNLTQPEYEDGVRRAKDFITAGEAIQVVLSRRLSRPTGATPFSIYRALRAINPSPYMYYLDLKDFYIMGTSPEILVKSQDGAVTTRPLAGTRPRGENPAEDARLEQELRSDEKERAEHVMLVDLGRNDIGRVSVPGTVAVSELMQVERYSHVMHLVTNVAGRLRPELTALDTLRACFPAGTVSGAPKIRAMEIIAGLEPDKRGPYAGCVGYFGFSGNMDTAITIRTIVMKDGIAYVQAGAGIVYDSVPEHEYAETGNKARAMLRAIEDAEALEKEARP
jgi:anthranilate synthase component I